MKPQSTILGVIVINLMAFFHETRGCHFEFLEDNCHCPEDNLPGNSVVTCTCASDKNLKLTYENLEGVLTDATEFRVENCPDVILDEGIIDHFTQLERMILTNITRLEVLPGSLYFYFSHANYLEVNHVKNVIVHPASISLGDIGLSNITIVNSTVSSSSTQDERENSVPASVSEASFKCDCSKLYWPVDNEVNSYMEQAVKCNINEKQKKKNSCAPQVPDASSNIEISRWTATLCLSVSLSVALYSLTSF